MLNIAETVVNASPAKNRFATSVFFFISGFGYASWASRIPSIQQQLHLNDAELGGILFAFPIGLVLTMPLTGSLLSRFKGKHIMLAGAILFNIMLALPGFAVLEWQLAAILLFFGASRNLLNLSMNAQALGVQAMYPKSIITSFHAVWSLAGFAGAAVGYVMVTLHIGPAFHLMGISLLSLALTGYFYPGSLDEPPSGQKKKLFSWPEKSLLNFAFISFACMACENTMYDWGIIYFEKVTASGKSTATAAFVIFMVAVTAGRLLGDSLVTKHGTNVILKFSGMSVAVGFLCCVLLPYVIPTCIGFIFIGLGISCIVPLVFSKAGKSKTLSSGPALASISTVGYLGFLVVPPMVGLISQVSSLRWAFVIMAALGLLIIWLVQKIVAGENATEHHV